MLVLDRLEFGGLEMSRPCTTVRNVKHRKNYEKIQKWPPLKGHYKEFRQDLTYFRITHHYSSEFQPFAQNFEYHDLSFLPPEPI
jgi:hypothetical protein